jgi:hypothetical protein
MSTTETVKKLFPLVRVVTSGRTVAEELRASRRETDLITRVHALANAVLVVTGLILVIRELRTGRRA